MQPKLGILAGGGLLPSCIVDACQVSGRPFHVIAFRGQASESLTHNIPHTWVRLGAGGKTLKTLHAQSVNEIILVGSIVRPTLAQLRPDAWGVKFLAKTGAMALGDDGLLASLLRTLELEEGFRALGVRDVAPQLLAPDGVVGTREASQVEMTDIAIAIEAACKLGAEDKGQAAVARDGQIIGLETSAGTDSLLNSIEPRSACADSSVRSGVLVKVAKPQQERRVDLPTIGTDTVRNIAKAGLAGIVVEADGALILEREKVGALADELGVFVMGISLANGDTSE